MEAPQYYLVICMYSSLTDASSQQDENFTVKLKTLIGQLSEFPRRSVQIGTVKSRKCHPEI